MLERLNQLEQNVEELKKFKKEISLDALKNDLQKQWSLRYGLFESIQIVIDLSCHLTAKYNLGNPKTYNECIELLLKEKYLSKSLAEVMMKMVGLRNILVHEYVLIDLQKLYALLNNLQDFALFANEVKDVI